MLIMLNDGKINGKQAKQIFEKIYNESKNPNQIVKELNLVQITDENVIKSIIEKYIDLNKEMMNQCKDRPERIEKFLIGMLMKETSGQANPLVSKKVLDEVLLKYK
ncbi:hypothetical protein FACS189459_0820 [Bacilli bacterium]|nr:hypothetical protein FACS189459_0820 [Bacilli bacterium]